MTGKSLHSVPNPMERYHQANAIRFRRWNSTMHNTSRAPVAWGAVFLLFLLFVCPTGCSSKSAAPKKSNSNAVTEPAKEPTPDGQPSEPQTSRSDSLSQSVEGDDTPLPHAEKESDGTTDPVRASLARGEWSTARILALASNGPVVFDISIDISESNLDDYSTRVIRELAGEIFDDSADSMSWEQLLEHPLISSGWLGNLVAEDEQRSQILDLYDSDENQIADLQELEAFLSRGLSRRSAVVVNDIGTAPDAPPSSSPWGNLDLNNDYALSISEAEQAERHAQGQDFNGDGIVALREIEQSQATSMSSTDSMMAGRSMLDTRSAISLADADAAESIKELVNYYTYLGSIPRDAWSGWSDERWKSFDSNEDNTLSRDELAGLTEVSPDVHIRLRLPSAVGSTAGSPTDKNGERGAESRGSESSETQAALVAWSEYPDAETNRPLDMDAWTRTMAGGRMNANGVILNVALQDAFASENQRLFRSQLQAALNNEQIANAIRNQLSLSEDALELVDVDGDGQLSDPEFAEVWKWICVRQGSRILVRWMLEGRPWFEVLDRNGDRRITEIELSHAAERLTELDRNGDAVVTPDELPMIVRAEIRRSDRRLDNGFLPPRADQEPTAPADWFAAMDSNQDGFIGKREFLGDSQDFDTLDSDSDGFISRREVYETARLD